MIKVYHVNPDTDWLGGTRNSAKVMIALRELRLPHEVVYLSRKRDMRDPGSEFRARINPWGTVPVLQEDDFILRESAAILRYLAELQPQMALFPHNSHARAHADEWLTWECSTLVPSLLNVVQLGRYDGIPEGKPDPIGAAQSLFERKLQIPGMRDAVARWNENLALLDSQLATFSYAAGQYSLADIALGCVVPVGPVFGMTLQPYPHIVRWLKHLEERPAWQAERTFTLDMNSGKSARLFPCSEAERAAIPVREWAAEP